MSTEYKFVIGRNWDKVYSFMACGENQGYLFYKNTKNYDDSVVAHKSPSYAFKFRKQAIQVKMEREVTLKEAFEKVGDKETKNKIAKLLGIKLDAPVIILNDKQKEEMLNKLRKHKAFNEDSAFEVESNKLDSYEALEVTGVIKSINSNKFFILEKPLDKQTFMF